jgi:dephospho-CoA kinase
MPSQGTKPVIGLVGGVGSGKSAAAGEFAALGCLVIDADAIGHKLLRAEDVRRRIRRRWGARVFDADGNVDRRALGRIVFGSADDLAALNEIVWPLIGGEISAALGAAVADPNVPAAVLDAAVLFEAGWDGMCSHVLFVDAPDEVRRQRAAARGVAEGAWAAREKSQFSLDIKKARCYVVVDNSSSLSHLREQVRRIFQRLASQDD